MKRIKKEVLFLGVFILIVGTFFYPTLRWGKLPVSSDTLVGLYHPWRDLYADRFPRGVPFKNFLITDPVRQQIPWRKLAIDQWKEGQLPLWNPYSFAGTPLSANIQAAVFYPFNLLFFFWPFPTAWTILVILQPLLAGVFLYIYLRYLSLHPLASLLGAIAWSFSGFSMAWLTWATLMQVALWLPLSLLAVDKVVKEGKTRYSWLLAASLTLQALAGHAQLAFYSFILVVCYASFQLLTSGAKTRVIRLKALLLSLGVLVLATSIQWIPFLRLVAESSRFADLEAWQKTGWFIPWQHLVQFVAPDFFGNPATLNYWGEWNYGEFVGYIGIVGMMMAILGMSPKVAGRRFWLIILGVTLLLALPTPMAKLPYLLRLPILSALQPTRLMMLIDFSLVMLSAYGADWWLRQPKPKTGWLVGGWGAVLVVLWIVVVFSQGENWLVARRNLILPTILVIASGGVIGLGQILPKLRLMLLGILLIFLSFDLLRFGAKFTPFTPAEYFFPKTRAVEFLENQPKPFRVAAVDDRLLPPNVAAYYGIESVAGYDPLYLARYEEFMAALERGRADITPPFGFNRIITPHNLDSPLLPLANVQFVLALGKLDKPYLREVFAEGETRIYEDDRTWPRAYLAETMVVETDKSKILERLLGAASVRASIAVVEQPVAVLSLPLTSADVVNLTSYSPNALELNTSTSNIRFLVVSNINYAGWEARVDGKKVSLYQTNYLFQGLVVPAGQHTIVLRYRG